MSSLASVLLSRLHRPAFFSASCIISIFSLRKFTVIIPPLYQGSQKQGTNTSHQSPSEVTPNTATGDQSVIIDMKLTNDRKAHLSIAPKTYSNMAPNSLTASYTSSSSEPFSITHSLPALESPASVADKTSYLASLRSAVTEAQAQINKELTSRMEEDNARAASKNGAVDDAKEEENYGEEIQEDED
ncbi:hypothetical protein EDB81DRAFT_878970 [Dactylonectria macrodidyma]|uniref:EKC/KEOPS complex subunit GON7 n=1 Tax=Dactylonectria macrodidyma TaxID=307937 RepID=A0A9P9FCZ4_9HYPO|nr:hypothetical protein EDB81DRAFT_878970 [Dactylonectria macrodidyma]